MRDEAVFINGIYRGVLDEILVVQEHLPDQILFLQPHKSQPIKHLMVSPPAVDDPVQLLASTTERLGEVEFAGEIVGWDDKRNLPEHRWHAISRIVWSLQSTEGGVYDRAAGSRCVNLLHVRRLRRLKRSIPVTQLIKTENGQPIRGERSRAGSWTYVERVEV
jgi:hypothetical protein